MNSYRLPVIFLNLIFIFTSIFFPSYVFSEEYKFTRMWPTLHQPWYFNNPQDIATDSKGYVYIADTENYRIQKFTSDGQFVARWSIINAPYYFPPLGIACDYDDYIYVADSEYIQKFTSSGEFVRKWQRDDGTDFNPSSVETDEKGFVYVTDIRNTCIHVFTNDGEFTGQWGIKGENDGEFLSPSAITLDNKGFAYVTDIKRHCVQKFQVLIENNILSVKFIRKWGLNGKEQEQFDHPFGIETDGSQVFVVDMKNDRVQVFNPDGVFI
ncbi:hypothetical protein QUF70_14840, partial [Desulfobacterales bacterium HSG17]|nr:hypothetical protein [Desulfobacterales bacterium HSG17]